MNKKRYSLPDIDWLLSFPTDEVMRYGISHDILDSPGLLTHVMLCRVLVFQLAKALPKNIPFNIDTALSLTTVYHATRQAADYGKVWKHPDPLVNEFMKTRWDMDFALNQAVEHWFHPDIVHWVANYRINPNSREAGYFPHESLSRNNVVNWTESIPMLTSWLVAGTITKTSIRFQDLRDRRSEEIGKLELPFWQKKIMDWEEVHLPEPIVAIATRESDYPDEDSIILWIKNGAINNAIMWKWILDWYEEWANMIIAEYCKLAGIDDFYKYLEDWVDVVGDARPWIKREIRTAFESLIGRPLGKNEFIPYVEWIDLVFKRIQWIKVASTRDLYHKKLTRIMSSAERTVWFLSKDSPIKDRRQNQDIHISNKNRIINMSADKIE